MWKGYDLVREQIVSDLATKYQKGKFPVWTP